MILKKENLIIIRLLGIALIVAAIVGAVWWISRSVASARVEIGSPREINVTPQKISEIKRISQWEFMRVVDEVVVDTTAHRTLLPDERLTCIFYGTLSLGIDLAKADDDWVTNRNDTLTVRLPLPSLLDERFIDEARTKVFYEYGSWRPSARNAMYRRAKVRMMERALTPSNLDKVRQAASYRFSSLFKELGAKDVIIEFGNSSK